MVGELKPDKAHPEFNAQADHYEMLRDFYRGVGAVREKKESYLPRTSGMIHAEDQNKAGERYKAFVSRATYPGILRHTVSSIVGLTTAKEPQIFDVPSKWEGVSDYATRDRETLQGFRGRLVRELSKLGRVGIMTDLRSENDELPVFTPFYANQIINWRTSVIDGRVMLTLLVIKKTESVKGEDYWQDETVEVVEVFELKPSGLFKRRFEKKNASDGRSSEWVDVAVSQPRSRSQARGAEPTTNERGSISGFRLMEIPFTPINTSGISIDPVDPPFLDLAHKLKDIYVNSANYREALSMYEPTPVVSGMTKEWIEEGFAPKYMGAGVVWNLPPGADAKMLEYNGRTIADIRQALMDDGAEAERLATQPFDKITAAPESGESKKERAKTKTNVIREIHLSAAAGIQEALRKAARWIGEPDDKIFYSVADDLDDVDMASTELKELTSAWLAGLVPDSDAHARLKSGGYSQLSFEQWLTEREGGKTGLI